MSAIVVNIHLSRLVVIQLLPDVCFVLQTTSYHATINWIKRALNVYLFNQSNKQSIIQSINKKINQSIKQSINQQEFSPLV